MKKFFFEKHPRIVLWVVNGAFFVILVIILTANIFSEAGFSAKYSIYDVLEYKIRCQGKRNIVLRENHPNSFQLKKSPYEVNKSYRFSVDENGFVYPSKIHEKPDLTLAFLGGSTTECENVEEYLRFPYLAGKLISEQTGKKVNSYNVGKSGNNSIHSVNNLLNKVVPLKPDYVIWMENINDLSTLLYEATFWNHNKTRSNLGCFTKKTSSLRNHNNEWSISPHRSKISDPNHRELVKAEYRKIIQIFIANVRAIGAKPILMTQFNRIEKDKNFTVPNASDSEFSKSYQSLYREFNQIIREVATQQKVPLIDLAAKIAAEEKLIYDVVHLTNSGSEMAAKIIALEFNKILK